MKGITISEMKLGDSASFTKTVSEHDVYTYAGVSGDFNPAHVNEVEAQKGMFGKRIAHGMLSAGSADGLPTASSAPASFPPSWPCSCPAPALYIWVRSSASPNRSSSATR